MTLNHIALIAQLVEQRTENPCVRGSSPRRGTRFRNLKAQFNPLGFFYAFFHANPSQLMPFSRNSF